MMILAFCQAGVIGIDLDGRLRTVAAFERRSPKSISMATARLAEAPPGNS